MKTKSQAAKIRTMLMKGKKPREVAESLRVPVSRVYTENWKMKNTSKRVPMAIDEIKMPKEQVKALTEAVTKKPAKATPLTDFVREELASLERRIDDMQTVASFLAIRLRQLEQNGE